MAFTLDKIFTTKTSAPSRITGITEVLPCEQLRPYVRCFWETPAVPNGRETRIIPDCCADIIISVSGGEAIGNFCGVSNKSFFARDCARVFGIRFYAWSVSLFSSVSVDGLFNGFLAASDVFGGIEGVVSEIADAATLTERIDIAQRFLLKRLHSERENSDVMNSLYLAVSKCGRVNISELSDYCAVSKRTLEREFRANIGVSPKQMIDLIRYQLLWQEIGKSKFDLLDSVEKLGYYDAAHLYHDFEKFHGIALPLVCNRV